MIKLYSDINISPIAEVQYYLREVSKHVPGIPATNPDGIYDNKTREAVKEFQKTYGLPVTGIVDLITWNKLIGEYDKYERKSRPPNKLDCFPNSSCEVKIDDECEIVYIIQILLNNFNKKYKNYKIVNITGKYDNETLNAVKCFQHANLLPTTGIVDKSTWDALSTINNTCHLYRTL